MGKSESFRFKDTVSQYKDLEGHWETGMWVFGDGECNVLMIKERGFILHLVPSTLQGLAWHGTRVSSLALQGGGQGVAVQAGERLHGKHGIVEAQEAQLGPRLVPEIAASTNIWESDSQEKT